MVISITQGMLDMNALKFKIGQGLTLSNATAYIVISSLTITDMVENPVIAISSVAALPAACTCQTPHRPTWWSSVGFDRGDCVYFDETVNASSLQVQQLTVQGVSNLNGVMATQSSYLFNSMGSVSADSTVVTVGLMTSDLNELKKGW